MSITLQNTQHEGSTTQTNCSSISEYICQGFESCQSLFHQWLNCTNQAQKITHISTDNNNNKFRSIHDTGIMCQYEPYEKSALYYWSNPRYPMIGLVILIIILIIGLIMAGYRLWTQDRVHAEKFKYTILRQSSKKT